MLQLAQVALRQAEADPGQGADQEAELVALGIRELGQLAEQLAEAQALALADRARGCERSEGGQLNPGRDREDHILTGLATTGVGGEQAQGGLKGPIHPGQGKAQQIAHQGVRGAAVP